MSLSTRTLLRAAAYVGEPRAGGHRTASPPGQILKAGWLKATRWVPTGRTNEARVVETVA